MRSPNPLPTRIGLGLMALAAVPLALLAYGYLWGLVPPDIVAANPFMAAAIVSLALIFLETVYLWAALPETHPQFTSLKHEEASESEGKQDNKSSSKAQAAKDTKKHVPHTNNPALLNAIHFLFLLPFSGLE